MELWYSETYDKLYILEGVTSMHEGLITPFYKMWYKNKIVYLVEHYIWNRYPKRRGMVFIGEADQWTQSYSS